MLAWSPPSRPARYREEIHLAEAVQRQLFLTPAIGSNSVRRHHDQEPMTESPNRRFLFREFFQLRVHRTSGEPFQRLFSQVMVMADPRFQPIAPWGNWGDGGNDGWIPEDGHYFQVFGPKPNSQHNPMAALQKAMDDLEKLKKWPQIRKYTFVINDRFESPPGPLGHELAKLKDEKGLEDARPLGTDHLLEIFMKLDEDQRQQIVGVVPADEIDPDLPILGKLLSALAHRAHASLSLLTESAPDFSQKIAFNGLEKPISTRLEAASWQSTTVDDFLRTYEPGLQQALAEDIRRLYKRSKVAIPETLPGFPNKRYLWMVEQLVVDTVVTHPHTQAAYMVAAEIILAKYFETCDAYEHPAQAVELAGGGEDQ